MVCWFVEFITNTERRESKVNMHVIKAVKYNHIKRVVSGVDKDDQSYFDEKINIQWLVGTSLCMMTH